MFDRIFTTQSSSATPVVLVDRGNFDARINACDERSRNWLFTHEFKPQPGRVCVVPSESGQLAEVWAAIDANDLYTLSLLPQLPSGDYAIDAARSAAIDPHRAALGFALGCYRFDRYRQNKRSHARMVLPHGVDQNALMADVAAVFKVRDLVNTPTEDLGPAHLAEEVKLLAAEHGASIKEWIGNDLLQANFPAIHAVGRASHRAPRLIELVWGDTRHPRLSIVGKGVCFDTGGLDIKPADGMRNMKKDMGGAAHAIALAQRVLAARLPVRLQLLIPAVENAIAGNAYRPGEIIKTRCGLNVEIDNTDAEGRVILCDTLTYASESQPELIIDFATLTGAARIALGPDLPPLFCNRDDWANAFVESATQVQDPVWRMPLWRPYRSMFDSSIADFTNCGASKHAGCITAALYLERFIPEGQAWMHLDTYSWNDSDRPGKPKGGEAQSLRAAFEFLRQRFV